MLQVYIPKVVNVLWRLSYSVTGNNITYRISFCESQLFVNFGRVIVDSFKTRVSTLWTLSTILEMQFVNVRKLN